MIKELYEGYTAYWLREPKSPYKKGTVEYKKWVKGWNMAALGEINDNRRGWPRVWSP